MFDVEQLKQMNFDVDATIARFAGNSGMYFKFLGKFLNDKSYENFEKALSENNFEAAEAAVHTLKGVAGNLGMTDLFNVSNNILTQIRNGNTSGIDAMVSELGIEYKRVTDFISGCQD